ncbi:hypothetical protein MKW92_028613 [Papaver armeniacum]|uniref:uncharacterized protein LOC113313526 n=1 Tax=Papaver somniferum TaxID=3469 RepID=UPI000E70225B|nr:uncharacterized protein LOC113313526 [Papaver somniferum]KAI3943445.1 hypothetical protein MKW92_028613 [Papaver armeniacum]
MAASSNFMKRWVRPEVYPLLVPMVTVVGLVSMQLFRNITTNPEVRVTKENRAAGILENFEEGEKYAEHGFRKFIRGRRPEIMPALNNFFTDPKF